jgi:hypothetical protein
VHPRAGVGTRDWLQAEGTPPSAERLDCMTDAIKLGEVGAVTHVPSGTATKGIPGVTRLGGETVEHGGSFDEIHGELLQDTAHHYPGMLPTSFTGSPNIPKRGRVSRTWRSWWS